MDSFKRFNETKLPNENNFFSSLKNCGIRATDVWKVFKIKTLGEYHDLYVKTDVLLLCDVFEKFIKTYLEYYSLDSSHCFSSPGLSWDAMLKMTGIKLEFISNIGIHLFIEKGMRGGISYFSKRYSKANENKSIMYWDANNLFAWTMIQSLPVNNFKFLSEKEINKFNLNSISENSSIGFILVVDFEYCKELHDLHSDYPLCPEKIEVNLNMLSKYCNDIANKNGIKVGDKVPNLGDKVKYVVHYKNLQYYLSLGIKLIKIHRILKFKQSNCLKECIELNAKKRQESTDKFNKNFFKLLLNCVYGKSMENIRKRINVKLINDSKEYLRCVSKPNFISQKIFDKNFIAVHKIKTVLILNKPIYVGFCILELIKLLMYKFHYNYVLNTFNTAKSLFTDTDNLVYEIKDRNVYEQCFKDKESFDFSGYSKDSVYYNSSNKKVLGKMKDEFNGIKTNEFVGLKSKMYSLNSVDNKEGNKAKGINKKLKHKEYIDVLFKKNVVRHNMKRIQSKLHEVGTYDIYKLF